MKTQEIFTIYPKTVEESKAIKAFLKALKIEFEVSKAEKQYNPEFVAKVLESQQQMKDGKVTSVKKENLKAFLDA